MLGAGGMRGVLVRTGWRHHEARSAPQIGEAPLAVDVGEGQIGRLEERPERAIAQAAQLVDQPPPMVTQRLTQVVEHDLAAGAVELQAAARREQREVLFDLTAHARPRGAE